MHHCITTLFMIVHNVIDFWECLVLGLISIEHLDTLPVEKGYTSFLGDWVKRGIIRKLYSPL